MIRIILISLFLFCANAEANRIDVVGGGGGSGSVSDTVYGAGWDGDTTVAPSKNAVYDKIETIASGGDNITVNTTAATNANFLDNLYIDWAIDIVATPDDITSKFNYAETLAGNPALLTGEVILTIDGLIAEGTTADAIEMKLAFPDPATTDKTITLPNATDTLVGKDTTDTLTNKTLAAASNVLDADTAVALAADPADCATSTHFAVGVIASGAATCEAIADADVPNTITIDLATTVTTNANLTGEVTSVGNATTIADSVTVTGWVLGTSTASSLASPIFATNNADPADAGIVRLGNAESIAWEAAPAGTDITLSVDASEVMQVSGALNAVGAITGSNLSGTNTGDNTVATSGDSATSFFSSGTLEVAIGGTGTTTSTGTGAVVLGTSPTITTSIDLPAGAINAATEIAADLITHTQIADADQMDTKCIWFENPVAADDFKSIWFNGTGNDFQVTEIWAESDQTVTFMLQLDDGTPADCDTVDLAPAAGTAEDTALDGDCLVAAGERLDLATTSVANTPTWVSICFTGNWVD